MRSELQRVAPLNINTRVSTNRNLAQTSLNNLKESQKGLKQCRICLENENQSQNGPYIRPCKCIGSVKHVHESCLKEWIRTSLNKKSNEEQQTIKKQGIQCQICKHLISFQVEFSYDCRECHQLKELFGVLIFLMSVTSIGLGFALYSIALNLFESTSKKSLSLSMILSICAAILLVLFWGTLLYIVCFEYFLLKESKLGNIQEYSGIQIHRRVQNQMIEFQQIDDNIEVIDLS